MKKFLKTKAIEDILTLTKLFVRMEKEVVKTNQSLGRVLGENIYSDIDIPGFTRSTMDGYAINASSSFGSSESNPVYLIVKNEIKMGEKPSFLINVGEAAKISTGGALPDGADSVVMIEDTNIIDKKTIEVYRSMVPGKNVIFVGDDIKKDDIAVKYGIKIRPQEMGLIAASGRNKVTVFKKPVVAIISTGNEIVPSKTIPVKGQVRDINSYTLAGQVIDAGAIPKNYGIISDNINILKKICFSALENSDMVIISGGSSMSDGDLTLEMLKSIDGTELLVHGISISPGKPTILVKYKNKQIWGVPGHVASSMVVFKIIIEEFLKYIAGVNKLDLSFYTTRAILSRNVSSSQGRVDYIRVKLIKKNGIMLADPIIGKSGLINTMVKADGLVKIGVNTEGLYKNTPVSVILF